MLDPQDLTAVATRFGVAEDLAGLATLDALGKEAADLFARSTGRRLTVHDFDRAPSDWEASLRHQTDRLPPALECLDSVRRAYAASISWS